MFYGFKFDVSKFRVGEVILRIIFVGLGGVILFFYFLLR